MPQLKYAELTDKIIGVFYSVYRELGFGFLESVYKNAMVLALREAGLNAEAECAITVRFRGQQVGTFRCDLVVEKLVLLELKTGDALDKSHEAQVINYLRSTDLEVGLLFNFGPQPSFRRLIFENNKK